MAEIKNTFLKGKMNQDLDSRILPNGEYREAINLAISRSEGSSVGEFENVLGNQLIATFGGLTSGSVIGNYVDETNNVVYLLVTDCDNSDPNLRCGFNAAGAAKKSAIYKVSLDPPFTISVLVFGKFLNFSKHFTVTGINLVDDFLFWTDNYNQPRKINVKSAENNYVSETNQYYTTEEQISVAKYSPYLSPVLMERTTAKIKNGATSTTTQCVLIATIGSIRVGDIITDHNKASGVTEQITTLVTVKRIDNTDANSPIIFFNPALSSALNNDTTLDFSRPSMTNKSDLYLSNSSKNNIVSAVGAGTSDIRIESFNFGGLPRYGDKVTVVSGTGTVPVGAIVLSCTISYVIASSTTRVVLTMSEAASLTGDEVIDIARNPDYDANFSGDPKWLEDKFVRFSYRFQYDDNEYSLMAPFTQPAFIPKQYSEFGAGQLDEKLEGGGNIQNNYSQDMVNAYKSTILSWFENNTDNVKVRIPVPYQTPASLIAGLKIKNIDILYKESDGLSVKVLDTIPLSSPTPVFTEISYEDDIHGTNDQYFYDYNYTSNKPYKTLPEGQTTRVYDRVPIRALAQELIGSRVVYGNYLEKMTPPLSLPYSVNVNKKSVIYDNFTQYPYHTLKQNRTYQVGIVLSDIYGRQSDAILSSNDDSSTATGSTFFFPYFPNGIDAGVFDWLGSALNITIEQPIGETINALTGEPGVYSVEGQVNVITLLAAGDNYDNNVTNVPTSYVTGSGGTGCTVDVTVSSAAVTKIVLNNPGSGYADGDVLKILMNGSDEDATFTINTVLASNPLGWYSYKIVVKQQEQEYYNVYMPGFINGLPIVNFPVDKNIQQLNQFAFSTLLSDNINKIPRNLAEVGPTDKEFNSNEVLYIRVNNPDIVKGALAAGVNYATNAPYYPGNFVQEVLNIATARDTELAAIPFKPNVPKGDYGQSTQTVIGGDGTLTLTGSIPYGTTGASESFYNTDQNPFIIKFDGSDNILNPIGAQVTNIAIGSATQGIQCMSPVLSVVETKPRYSLLDIYWETSLTGKIQDLNRAINNTFNGVSGLTRTSFTFPESIGINNTDDFVPDTGFQAIDGSGAPIGSGSVPAITIESISTQSGQVIDVANWPFQILTTGFLYKLKTKDIKFVFTAGSLNNFTDNYIVQLKCVYGQDASGPVETNFININANLSNVIPLIDNCNAPAGITVASTTIKSFSGENGSSDASNDEVGLVWSLGNVIIFNTSTLAPNIFTINSSTGVLSAVNQADQTSYTVPVTVTDASGDGLTSDICNLLVSVGAQRVPRAICNGRQGNAVSQSCGKNSEWLFAQTASTGLQAGGLSYPTGAVYPPNSLYNVRASYSSGSCATGALSQGIMTLKPSLYGGTSAGDAIVTFWIQYRSSNSQAWVIATAVAGSGLETVCDGLQINAAGNSTTIKTYKFSALGEYRVVTNYITGDNCAGNPNFYVDFTDAIYNPCSDLNPC